MRLLVLIALGVLFAAPAQAASGGRPIVIGQSYTLPSAVLGETRRINVYLPPSYGQGTKTYPVIVLLDGGEAEDFHHITGLVQVGSVDGVTREVIVVGVENTDRKRDLTYPSSEPKEQKALPTSGGSARFRTFLADELSPWIRANYRTSSETALMGESLAGLFVVETFLDRPELFTDYIAISPSLWWDKEILSHRAAEAFKRHDYAGKSFSLSVAWEGGAMEPGAQTLADALKTVAPKGLKWRFDPMPDERHATIYDPAAIKAIRWLFAAPAS